MEPTRGYCCHAKSKARENGWEKRSRQGQRLTSDEDGFGEWRGNGKGASSTGVHKQASLELGHGVLKSYRVMHEDRAGPKIDEVLVKPMAPTQTSVPQIKQGRQCR